MCKITNKCLFASGFGMQMLVHYCATTFTELNVINGGERGGPLSTIKDVPLKLVATGHNPLKKKDLVFLDNLTGDYYVYNEHTNEWKPSGNVGLHYSRALASLGGGIGGDLVKKVSTYQAKATDLQPQLFFSKLTDVKCTIKKQYISHALMEGLPQEFVVDNRNTWDPHPVNITNMSLVEKLYDTLAESERGPQVCTHKNTLVV